MLFYTLPFRRAIDAYFALWRVSPSLFFPAARLRATFSPERHALSPAIFACLDVDTSRHCYRYIDYAPFDACCHFAFLHAAYAIRYNNTTLFGH